MKTLTLNDLLAAFKNHFTNYPMVKKVAIYKDVAFVEVQTSLLAFAIEVKTSGDIELVFRNNDTMQKFSLFFNHPFTKGSLVYKDNICVNPLFSFDDNNIFVDYSLLLVGRTKHILGLCFDVEKNATLWLEHFLKKHQELLTMDAYNNVMFNMVEHMQPRLLSMLDTMKKIRDEELSIARFGNAEIELMLTRTGIDFQKHDWKLMRELRDITSEENDLLVCYPSIMSQEPWWRRFWARFWAECKFYMKKETYGDSFISRPEAFYQYGNEIAEIWRDIWRDKKVCFITGEGSRFNAQHYIFETIKDAEYIYSKPKDAYEDIDNVMEKCLALKDIDIFIIALGAPGTVVAYRLYKLGHRALDIGHLNNSYDTVFNNAPIPERIKAF